MILNRPIGLFLILVVSAFNSLAMDAESWDRKIFPLTSLEGLDLMNVNPIVS